MVIGVVLEVDLFGFVEFVFIYVGGIVGVYYVSGIDGGSGILVLFGGFYVVFGVSGG